MGKLKIVWVHVSSLTSPLLDFLDPEQFQVVAPKTGDEAELKRLVADADFLVVRRLPPRLKITRDIIDAGKRLKLIQRVSTRYDDIDIEAAREVGIPVAIMPVASDVAVSEHAIMFMIALSKNLIKAHNAVVNAEYLNLNLTPTPTTESIIAENWVKLPSGAIYQKTLGLVGMGEIGRMVAKRARCFGMKIIYYDLYKLSDSEERELGAEYRPFTELLKEADFVSLHVPHTEETDKMVGRRELSLMKPTAFLINVCRGGVVDEDALYQALKNRVIAGAGLDVFREEPVPKDNPLLRLDNVILTPHIAGVSELIYSAYKGVCDNILRVARGERAKNIVNDL